MSELEASRIKKRPPLITQAIIVVAFASTIIGVVGGLSLLWPGTILNILWELNPAALAGFMQVGQPVAGSLLVCLGVVSSLVGVGLLKGKAWAWWAALLLLAAVLGVNIVRLLTGDPGELFGTPFTAGLLWLHVRPNVRRFYFPEVRTSNSHPTG